MSRVILNGVPERSHSGVRRLELDASAINVGFVGRFDHQKGADLLLAALARVTRPDLRLYLLGDFDRDAAHAGLAPDDARVRRLGWIAREHIDDYLRELDAVVVPSRWEAFGLVAAEAMRNGKPVLVSHRGGLPEQVIHGYNGLVFALEDADGLARLFATLDKAELAEMGRNARRVWARSFSEHRAYQELIDVYAQVSPAFRAALSTAPPASVEQGPAVTAIGGTHRDNVAPRSAR